MSKEHARDQATHYYKNDFDTMVAEAKGKKKTSRPTVKKQIATIGFQAEEAGLKIKNFTNIFP